MPENPILRHLAAGTLLRGYWGDGHERACWLSALAPVTASRRSASACPAEIMPEWLAHLTMRMDDLGSDGVWHETATRYAGLSARWSVLSTADWNGLDWAAQRIALEIGGPLEGPLFSLGCEAVVEMLRRAEAGDDVDKKEWARVARAFVLSSCWGVMNSAKNRTAQTASKAMLMTRRRSLRPMEATDAMTAGILDAIEAAIVKAEKV